MKVLKLIYWLFQQFQLLDCSFSCINTGCLLFWSSFVSLEMGVSSELSRNNMVGSRDVKMYTKLPHPCICYVLFRRLTVYYKKCNTEFIPFSFNKEEPT